jgi:hypothetical protein
MRAILGNLETLGQICFEKRRDKGVFASRKETVDMFEDINPH